MVLSQNILFFDINYGEFASVTGTNLHTETAEYGYDNRSALLVDFSTCTGEYVYDFGSGSSYDIDSLILCNHNLVDFSFQYYTGTTWVTYGAAYTSNSGTTTYYNSGSVTTMQDIKVNYTKTVNSDPAYFGEFIVTKKKFQLNYNPSTYIPKMNPLGVKKETWDGKMIYNTRGDMFSADLGWRLLMGDSVSLVNTDLQNVTELFRKNTTFLFWPNANNTFPNMFTWRKQDLYKCKCIDAVSYEFVASHLDYIIKANYTIQEVV